MLHKHSPVVCVFFSASSAYETNAATIIIMKHLLHKHRGTQVLGHSFMAENTRNFSPLFPPSACSLQPHHIHWNNIIALILHATIQYVSSVSHLFGWGKYSSMFRKKRDIVEIVSSLPSFSSSTNTTDSLLFLIRDIRLWCNVSRCVRLPRAERKQTSVKLCRVDCVIEKLSSVWMWK